MPIHLQLLAGATLLHLLMILTGALLAGRLYSVAGFKWAAGPRDKPFEGETPAFIGRADRAAKNMTENMVFFAPVLLAGHAGGVDPATLALGAKIFLFARVAYWPLYLFGVPYLRTLSWVVSLSGIGIILAAIL